MLHIQYNFGRFYTFVYKFLFFTFSKTWKLFQTFLPLIKKAAKA